VINWLKGKKTYLLCSGGLVSGIYMISQGQTAEGAKLVWESAVAIAVRLGIAKQGLHGAQVLDSLIDLAKVRAQK